VESLVGQFPITRLHVQVTAAKRGEDNFRIADYSELEGSRPKNSAPASDVNDEKRFVSRAKRLWIRIFDGWGTMPLR